MMMAPDADAGDGFVDVIRVGALGRTRFVTAFPHIFRGTHTRLSGIEQQRAKLVEFEETHPQDVMIDGEILNLELKRLEVLHEAAEVLA